MGEPFARELDEINKKLIPIDAPVKRAETPIPLNAALRILVSVKLNINTTQVKPKPLKTTSQI
jgi:hypothetical protein